MLGWRLKLLSSHVTVFFLFFPVIWSALTASPWIIFIRDSVSGIFSIFRRRFFQLNIKVNSFDLTLFEYIRPISIHPCTLISRMYLSFKVSLRLHFYIEILSSILPWWLAAYYCPFFWFGICQRIRVICLIDQ